jgi:hypothetical protein
VIDAGVVELLRHSCGEPLLERAFRDLDAVQQGSLGARSPGRSGRHRHGLEDEVGPQVASLHPATHVGEVLVPHQQGARQGRQHPLDGTSPLGEAGPHLDELAGERQSSLAEAELLGELLARAQ